MNAIFLTITFIIALFLSGGLPWQGDFYNNQRNITPFPTQPISQTDCLPKIENEYITPQIFGETTGSIYWHGVGGDRDYHPLNLSQKHWILVKRNITLPSWKARWNCCLSSCEAAPPYDCPNSGECGSDGRCNPQREIDLIGKVAQATDPSLIGKKVFIGVGHCKHWDENYCKNHFPCPSGDEGEECRQRCPDACYDPLTADVLYVPTDEPRDPFDPACGVAGITPPWGNNPSDCWWTYNLYYNADKLPPNPTEDDLPCWMKFACASPGEKDLAYCRLYAAITNCGQGRSLINPSPTPDARWAQCQSMLLGKKEGVFAQNNEGRVLAAQQQKDSKTLKLGTFLPGRKTNPDGYQWWTPACKPAIYLYPKKKTWLSVSVKPDGYLTETTPAYEGGWKNVLAQPDGTVEYRGKQYPYLYYEAQINRLTAPKKGFVVKKEELSSFFDRLLPSLGLIEKEVQDFKTYWLEALQNSPYYFIGPIPQSELEKKEKIEFSQQPDVFIRVRLFFEELKEPISIASPSLPVPPKREGFVAVDWGGVLASGSCPDGVLKTVESK